VDSDQLAGYCLKLPTSIPSGQPSLALTGSSTRVFPCQTTTPITTTREITPVKRTLVQNPLPI